MAVVSNKQIISCIAQGSSMADNQHYGTFTQFMEEIYSFYQCGFELIQSDISTSERSVPWLFFFSNYFFSKEKGCSFLQMSQPGSTAPPIEIQSGHPEPCDCSTGMQRNGQIVFCFWLESPANTYSPTLLRGGMQAVKGVSRGKRSLAEVGRGQWVSTDPLML